MCKLWAFGDSHIAGSGLANYNHDQIIDWIKKYTGYPTYHKYNESTNFNEKLTEELLTKWNKKCKRTYPENSYAGRIAKKLNYKLVCKAKAGSGIDFSFKEINENKKEINWKKDIVFLNLPPVYRYYSNNNKCIQYALIDKKTYLRSPSLKTIEDMYLCMYHYIRKEYPLVKIIQITKESLFNDNLQNICESDNSIYIDDQKHLFDNPYTPCGHWINELHETFSNSLIKDLKLKE